MTEKQVEAVAIEIAWLDAPDHYMPEVPDEQAKLEWWDEHTHEWRELQSCKARAVLALPWLASALRLAEDEAAYCDKGDAYNAAWTEANKVDFMRLTLDRKFYQEMNTAQKIYHASLRAYRVARRLLEDGA